MRRCRRKISPIRRRRALAIKIIENCHEIAEKEEVKQRQSYKFVSQDLLTVANSKSKEKEVERKKAKRKIKTIAGRLVRELKRKLSEKGLKRNLEELEKYDKVLKQKKNDKNKIYSLHESGVSCIAKGKAHKKYEFGSKVSFAVGQKSNLIKAAVSFRGNPNDNQTLEKTLEQQERITGERPEKAYTDRGYKSRQIEETEVVTPSNGVGKTASEKNKLRKSFRRRAGIEPIIGHVKADFGMERNYLKGEIGDEINAILAASAFNFKSWIRKEVGKLIFVLNYLKWSWTIWSLKRFTDDWRVNNNKTNHALP